MPYRNKTFVSFDGDSDMSYYRLMQAWKQNDGIAFNFYNAHDLNTARDSSQEASIKAQLSERMRNTSVFVLLVGERTRYLQKFVRWEIEQAIKTRSADNCCEPQWQAIHGRGQVPSSATRRARYSRQLQRHNYAACPRSLALLA